MKTPQPAQSSSFPRSIVRTLCGILLLAGFLPAPAQTAPVSAPAGNTTATAPAAFTPAGNTTSTATLALSPPAAPAVNTAIVPAPRNGGWMNRHQGFADLAKAGNIDVLFLGDSITDYWRDDGANSAHRGKPVWDQYYGSLKAANFGISADRTQHVLWRLQNGEGKGFKPKVIILMIGTNNTGLEGRGNTSIRNTVPQATAGVIAVVEELRKDFPDAKILLLGIFPRGPADDPQRQQVADINTAISALNDDQHVFYLYIGDKFLGPDGNIPKDVMADSLHPTTKGYQIWADAMKDELAKLLN